MQYDVIHKLFDVSSHNPSFMTLRSSCAYEGELLDFCVPINTRFPPPELLRSLIENLGDVLQFYPDYADVHQLQIAALTGLDADLIVPANGSTEVITRICQDMPGPMVTSVPTFGRWTDLPIESGLPLHVIERRRDRGFRLEVDEIVAHVRSAGASTLVLSNPNNPTGVAMPLGDVVAVASALPDLHTIVIDESFIDFSDVESASQLVGRLPNLMVVKSMGKSIGWHGVRLGYAVAERQRAQSLRGRLPFWNINGVAAFVLRSLSRFSSEYHASFPAAAGDRAYMFARLSAIPELTVYPSQANFILVELPETISGRLLRDRLLANHGVVVRETSNKVGSTEQYVRLAVQRPHVVDVLDRALRAELAAMSISPPAPA